MNDQTLTTESIPDRVLNLTSAEYCLLIEVLSTRYAELREEQSQGNEEPWLGNTIDELEGLNYKIHFIPGSDIDDLSDTDDPVDEADYEPMPAIEADAWETGSDI